ncbi:hypothetical protein E3N88_00085 [Mikania micrantha]|uniref:Uncharacterized protein n=1 Tax=Mikania micrantha TaxID=192012 RepID=A0A5N6PX43_9ASTR|nr:hypothetical protein E3N88_00085 [Mikania micrantha]
MGAAVKGGAIFGYDLIILMFVFSLVAVLCQYLSASITVVTGRDHAQNTKSWIIIAVKGYKRTHGAMQCNRAGLLAFEDAFRIPIKRTIAGTNVVQYFFFDQKLVKLEAFWTKVTQLIK